MPYAIGIDLGGTNIKAMCVSPDGRVHDRRSFATDDEPGARPRWGQRIVELIEQLQRDRGEPARWVGLASPGLARPDGRSIVWMQGRLDAVQDLDWTQLLDWPRLVPVLNDAHAALLGEVWQGAAVDARDAVLLTLGTGVGGAILADGKILKGHIGRAGHLGHICLDPDGPLDIVNTPGSLEDHVGNCTLAARSHDRFTTMQQLVEAAAGDDEAARLWRDTVYALACGITSIINAVDPQVVILGGGIALAGDALFKPLEEHLARIEWRPTGSAVRIVPAQLGQFAGALGAARNAILSDDETMDELG